MTSRGSEPTPFPEVKCSTQGRFGSVTNEEGKLQVKARAEKKKCVQSSDQKTRRGSVESGRPAEVERQGVEGYGRES